MEEPGATIEAMRQALVALTARVARLESQLVDVYAHEDEEPSETTTVPGFVCVDHVAMAVPPGELEAHVRAYKAIGFTEVHREDVLGTDQVREVLLRIGHWAQPRTAPRAADARSRRSRGRSRRTAGVAAWRTWPCG